MTHRNPLLLLMLFGLAITVAAQDGPPKAPVREVTDSYFGTKIMDPYRWMEDAKSPELAAWMRGQADYTRTYLDRLSLRAELLNRLDQLSGAEVHLSGFQRAGSFYFYFKLMPGENDRRLYMREGLKGSERLLIDPAKLSSPGKRYSIDSYHPSFDGNYVSYTISIGGSENGEMRIIETASGRDLGERIDRCRLGAGEWLPDNRSFLYNRLQKLEQDAPPTEFFQKSRVYLHTIGSNPDNDRVIFGYGVNPNIMMEPTLLPFAFVPIGSNYVFATVNSGVSPNSEYYFTTPDKLGETPIPWRRIAALDDEIVNTDIHGDDLYLITYKNTPRFKVIHVNLHQPDLAKADTVFPASAAVVVNIGTAKDALYVQTLDGGVGKLWRLEYKSGAAKPIKLPYEGTTFIRWTDQQTEGLLFGLTSWTKSVAFFALNPKTDASTDTMFVPRVPIDMSSIETASVKVKSYDGVIVPLVILYRRGLKRDGSNPTLLSGYGAYGINNTEPFFASNFLPWLERGGIIALAGVRGGGEYGEEWHLAGKQKTKPNTWKDFIACAEYLIDEKYTSPAHLSGWGVSAGGILIANSITERPDLFAAAIDQVGDNNALRFETTSTGVPNIAEFGSVKTEEGFKSLLAMDAYHKVKDGVKYPAVLLTTGINDARVEPWMSAKMTARLQAASSSDKPILLRVDYDAGHGIGSTTQQRNELNADIYAFLFQQLRSN